MTNQHTTTATNFDLFKKECKKLIDLLELNNWEVYFTHTDLVDEFAGIDFNSNDMVATLYLSTNWGTGINNTVTNAAIKSSALHEVIHLLLASLVGLALDRFSTRQEIDRETETMVNKLITILNKNCH